MTDQTFKPSFDSEAGRLALAEIEAADHDRARNIVGRVAAKTVEGIAYYFGKLLDDAKAGIEAGEADFAAAQAYFNDREGMLSVITILLDLVARDYVGVAVGEGVEHVKTLDARMQAEQAKAEDLLKQLGIDPSKLFGNQTN
jgi:hypothetical protein